MGVSGSALATETGHVILMTNDIRRVPKAIKLARKAHVKVIENVVLSISTKAAIVALAIAGHPLIWATVLADVGTCVLVICNSMLLLRRQSIHNHAGKCSKSSAAQHNNKEYDSNMAKAEKRCCTSNLVSTKSGCCNKNVVTMSKAGKGCCASTCKSSYASTESCTKSKGKDTANEAPEAKPCCSVGCSSAGSSTKLINLQNKGCSSSKHNLESRHESEGEVNSEDNLKDGLDSAEVKCRHHHEKAGDCSNNSSRDSIAPELQGEPSLNCCNERRDACYITVDVPAGDCGETTNFSHVCGSLKQRRLGSCCKSYRKECCGQERDNSFGGPVHYL